MRRTTNKGKNKRKEKRRKQMEYHAEHLGSQRDHGVKNSVRMGNGDSPSVSADANGSTISTLTFGEREGSCSGHEAVETDEKVKGRVFLWRTTHLTGHN